MGMPIELNTMIVTKGNETREEENIFRLAKDGYRLYPIDIPIDVRKTKQSDTSGTAVIQKVEWTGEKTIITYELLSLNSTN
ncbi:MULTISPECIES: DUF2584 domain-containing protein [Bacillaceae]|uniref:DUF2584 domain-containing protein n=1 Tax=Peribacillus simplex TaxID=1478 RepID=A0A109MYZ6_9BACI|nr:MULTISPECIES: DUF2584 domain-containing protein [Bacillaceae]KWW20449.1 hypothetical protein AS888_18985 [Peribacillus simplex]PJN88065.1 DUF2584 domain-containing protein [Bacillus sp. mrc49]PJN89118.1 DUF2584 domain-containing protein [Bacillus sp. mrc49]